LPPHHPTIAATVTVRLENNATQDAVVTQADQTALEAAADQARSRAAHHAAQRAAHAHHPQDNLDGWIRQARAIMRKHNIPGSYEGIKRNIIRESGGNPHAANNWDVNAQTGTPSQGLLQMIQPTFAQYHVKGTANELTDPVANIAAACNYAADRYGSIDHVNSAY
jgi:soluble lytic murein transglycosylase-like protein